MRTFLLLLALASPAAAQTEGLTPSSWLYKAGGKYSAGTGGFRSRSAYVQAGSRWKLRAGYTGYDYDGSTGTTHTGSLRASFQGEHLSLGVNGAFTPLVMDYRSQSWGAEAGWLFTPGDADDDAFIEEVELSSWWTQTRHEQTLLPNVAGRPSVQFVVNQQDIGGGLSLTAGIATLSLDGSASLYDRSGAAVVAVSAAKPRPRLAAAADLVNGFPENAQTARLDLEAAGWAVPFVSLTRTDYHIDDQPASMTGGLGSTFKWGRFGAELAYEVSRQRGEDDTRTVSAGASVRF
jgi:hypothetical protein